MSRVRAFIHLTALEVKNPLMLRRLYRSQVLLGHTMMGLAAFMAVNTTRPSLWLLEGWGGYHVSPYVWAAIFAVTGLALLRGYRVTIALTGACFAFIELMTVGAAGYLAQGVNVMTIMALTLAIHSAWTAVDLHSLLRRDMIKGPG